jgi:Xaa-Pro aminopeptidase
LRPGATSTEINDATGEAAKKYFGDNLQLIWGQDAEEGEASEWWGVGHGVGIEVHEFPFIGYHHITDDDIYRAVTLQENMVISIEPTIYTPETGPIQLEDQFVVTPQGGKQVSPVPFKLFECSA